MRARPRPANARNDRDEVGIVDGDLDRFEQLLTEVQTAFGREDYAALRAVTTPEIMSYLSEELSQNATSGVRNDVTEVKLLQGDLAEAWREDGSDYATVAMRYESRDVMRDRKDGLVVSGGRIASDRDDRIVDVRAAGRRRLEALGDPGSLSPSARSARKRGNAGKRPAFKNAASSAFRGSRRRASMVMVKLRLLVRAVHRAPGSGRPRNDVRIEFAGFGS